MDKIKKERLYVVDDTAYRTYVIRNEGKDYEIIFKVKGDSLWRHTMHFYFLRLSVTIYPITKDRRVAIRDGTGRDYYKGMTVAVREGMVKKRNIMDTRNLMQYDFTAEQVGMLKRVSQFIDARMHVLEELEVIFGGV